MNLLPWGDTEAFSHLLSLWVGEDHPVDKLNEVVNKEVDQQIQPHQLVEAALPSKR